MFVENIEEKYVSDNSVSSLYGKLKTLSQLNKNYTNNLKNYDGLNKEK